MTTGEQGRIEWFCDECGDKIEDGDGILGLSDHSIKAWREYEGAHEQWRHEQGSKSRLIRLGHPDPSEPSVPARGKWEAAHFTCLDGEWLGYDIAVGRLRIPGHIMQWTDHFRVRHWGSSNWIDITMAAIALGEGGKDRRLDRVFA